MKRLRNKKLAELQRKMNKCKKGSRQWKKYNRAKRYILSKAKAQSTNALHKISRKFVNWCVEQRITQVLHTNLEEVHFSDLPEHVLVRVPVLIFVLVLVRLLIGCISFSYKIEA
jgi:putative transposase